MSKSMMPMFEHFGTIPRVGVALGAGALTFLLSWLTFPNEESFFWTVIVTSATAVFLLVKQEVSVREKFKRVGLWDLLAPAALILLATVNNPQGPTESVLRDNSLRLVFAVIFFVGIGTALRVVFGLGKRD